MAPRPTATVAIRMFTEERLPAIMAAVESVRNQTIQPDAILLIVDNNPRLERLMRDLYPDIEVLPNARTRGIGGGSNTALEAATTDVVAFLDDDAAAAPDWLESLLVPFQRDARVVAVGGYNEPHWMTGDRPAWMPPEFDWVFGCSHRGVPTEVTEIRNLWGCNNALLRERLLAVGGFAEAGLGRLGKHPVGGEDTEICIRLKQHDPLAKILMVPEARIRHQVSAERACPRYFRSRCYHEGKSKALLAHLVGADDGLADERSYTLKVLPMGVLRGLREATIGRDISGLKRSGMIVLGFGLTVSGYLVGTVARIVTRTKIEPMPNGPITPSAPRAA